jgi:hypothetical protein
MVYVEIEKGSDPCRIVESLSSNLMFDYAWVLGEHVSIYRTFGDLRFITPKDQDTDSTSKRNVALGPSIELGTIPKLFDRRADYKRLGSRIWDLALAHAQSMNNSLPLKNRLLEAMGEISDWLIAAISRRQAEHGSDSKLHFPLLGMKPSSASASQEEIQSLFLSDYSLHGQKEEVTPSFLNWIHENITCSLLNAGDDSISNMLPPRGLKRNNRRTGSFYTPDHITRYIASNSLSHWLKARTEIDLADPQQLAALTKEQREESLSLLRHVKILDPAVGGGVFMIAAGEWLEAARLLLGDSAAHHAIRAEIINTNLNGIDVMAESVDLCRMRLTLWYLSSLDENSECEQLEVNRVIRCGNSLIDPQFNEMMGNGHDCFDLVIGNPPYGNILSTSERRALSDTYGGLVSGGEEGTWNTAAFFIVLAKTLLKPNGEIGFIVPNSVLRVHQFSKTRSFLLEHLKMWEIDDEGSPFEGVTLEMVSLFCTAEDDRGGHDIRVVSRRPGTEGINNVPWDVLRSARIFVLYYDDILARILQRSARDLLTASRGKDIPKDHVREKSKGVYVVPYATKGRSVKRYNIDSEHLIHADQWFREDHSLMESYSNRFLVATKNYPYPRCVMKPKGIIHGGGAVKIQPADQSFDLEALGAILNSRMVRYVCTRYLTNYSQLTTCMNTGIFEDLPVAYPKEDGALAVLFRSLSELHSRKTPNQNEMKAIACLERVTDAITYSLYLGNEPDLVRTVSNALNSSKSLANSHDVYGALDRVEVERHVSRVMEDPIVKRIESSPFMSVETTSRRH